MNSNNLILNLYGCNAFLFSSIVVYHCLTQTTATITRGGCAILIHNTRDSSFLIHTIDGRSCQGDELGFEKIKILPIGTSAKIVYQI